MSSLVWVELSAGSPDRNLAEIRRGHGFRGIHCAVVKSNAYGHGVSEMLPLLPSAGWLAVNSLEEGLEIRALGENRPVLLLGHVPLARLSEAREAHLRIMVCNFETATAISSLPPSEKELIVHMKVETGTWRQGVLPEDATALAGRLTDIPGTVLEGVYTHFANIEDTLDHQYAGSQLSRFQEVLDTWAGTVSDPR